MRAALFDALDLHDVTLVVPGLGRAHRAAARRRAPRPLRARRHREHLPADRRHAARRRVPRLAAVLADGRRLRGRASSSAPAATRSRATRSSPAYDAPFPDDTYKAGARQFPMLVPTTPDDPGVGREPRRRGRRCARGRSRSSPRSPTRTRSPAAATTSFQREVPGCAGQPHTTIEGGGHFLQEDKGAELARVVVDWIDRRVPTVTRPTNRSTCSRCSTKCRRSRARACTTARTRSTASATRGSSTRREREYVGAHVARPRRRPRPVRRRDRLRHREGRRRRGRLRRARPHPARAPRRRRQVGPRSRVGSTRTSRRSRPSCASSPRKPGVEARVDASRRACSSARRAPASTRTARSRSSTSARSPAAGPRPQLHEVTELAWRAIDDVARRRVASPPRAPRPRRARCPLAARRTGL